MTTITHDLRDTLVGAEIEIYQLLCQNMTNQEISEQINMPMPTVAWNLRRIYEKLGVQSRDNSDRQSTRRRAILYAGTRIEQTISYENSRDKYFSLVEIQNAAKKSGFSIEQTKNLISFLEMNAL